MTMVSQLRGPREVLLGTGLRRVVDTEVPLFHHPPFLSRVTFGAALEQIDPFL
jgi:hypothetical protein